MITFKDLGYGSCGIGNQMFQYAALRGIASKLNQEWKIPHITSKTSDVLFGDLFRCFKMESAIGKYINDEEFETIHCNKFNFDPQLFKIKKDNFNLKGYFQSFKYFTHIESEIRKDFTFKNQIHLDDEYIFLHVRRGDYIKLASHHIPCPISYYERALELFPKSMSVKVYSDDKEWCRENFKSNRFIINDEESYYEQMIFNPGLREYQPFLLPYNDLCEMSQCKGGIISNSSLSWWGAWLIKDATYPIVAPEPWFGRSLSHHDTSDLIPDNWHIINWEKI